MPSFEIQADIFTRLSVSDSPKGSSNTFKTHKNISLYFKRRYLVIYKYSKKSVKGLASLPQFHIFIDPVSQIIFFLVGISTMA